MQRAQPRRRFGVVVGLLLAMTGVVGLVAPAVAQTGDEPELAAVEREAYFTYPSDEALPATITAEFPPGIVCILRPEVCGTQSAPVTDPLGGAVSPVFDATVPDYQAPQPVAPGTLPVGMNSGKPRYTSYLKFALPSIPSGSLISRFDLILSESEVSYAFESPAFQQAILAGLVTYQTRTPDEFVKFVGDVATMTTPLADFAPTGIELCAVTAAWAPVTSGDPATQPARDCILGANGIRSEDDGTWTFDLSLLAQAWVDGTSPNEGIALGPIGADNLAFGDPDVSTNWQVSLFGVRATDAADRPRIRYSYSEGFGDSGTFEEILTPIDDGSGFGGVVAGQDPFSAGGLDDGALAGGTAPPAVGGPVPAPLQGALASQSRPRSPWWLWLLLPAGLAIAYAYSRSLDEEPAPGRAGRGALTRLMASPGDRPAG